MSILIVGVAFLINIYIAVKDYKKGIKLFSILILTVPPLKLSEVGIDYFILGMLPMLFIFLIFHRNIKKYINYILVYWYMYITVTIFSTVISLIARNPNEILIINIIGLTLRLVFLFLLTNSNMVLKDYIDIFKVVLVINFCIAIYQLCFKNSVNIFYELYYTNSLTPLIQVKDLGYFNRAYGLFATPVRVGAFSLVSFVIFIFWGSKTNIYQGNYKYSIMSALLGLMALSKTAIVGIPILLLIFAIYRVVKNRGNIIIKNFAYKITGIFMGGVVIYKSIDIMDKNGFYIMWYLDKLKNPLEIFMTRYNSNNGILDSTMKIIKQYWVTGVGSVILENEFTGDSLYTTILHDTGIVGLIIIILMLIVTIKKCIYMDRFKVIVLIGVLAAIGLGSNILFDEIGLVFLAFIYAITNKRNTNDNISVIV